MNYQTPNTLTEREEQLFYGIALSKIQGVGHLLARVLTSYCGGFKEIFYSTSKQLLKIPNIGEHTARQISTFRNFSEIEKEWRIIDQEGIQPIFFNDTSFPYRLSQIHNSPFLLYAKGNVNVNHQRIIAVVGTRSPSSQAHRWTQEFIEALIPYDVLVSSGFAYGIDIAAHKACMQHRIPTVGILAGGFGTIYPAIHKKYMPSMCELGGFITESSYEVLPDRNRFPMRNRIIAGMCDGLLIVESAVKGGSMITADFAFSYDKTLMAVPGKPSDVMSKGCNMLIKQQKAAMVEKIDDVVEAMNWDIPNAKSDLVQQTLFRQLSDKEQLILDTIRTQGTIHIDELTRSTGIRNSEMAALLLVLSMEGYITQLPGSRLTMG